MTEPAPFVIKGSATQRVHGSARSAQTLLAESERLGATRVFLLAGRTLAETTPHVRAIEAALEGRHAGTFTGLAAQTPADDVVAATLAAREARADLVVTIGGGAQTDAGKIIGLALHAGVTDRAGLFALSARCGWDKYDVDDPAIAPGVPVICIPTTLSGGEFNAGSGMTDEEGRKHPFLHRHSVPVSIILDPWISMATPEWLWLSTGMRAVDHAVETLASLRSNPYCDALAQAALRLLAPALRRVKAAPDDIAARSDCQSGVFLAMQPLISGVPMGASHAIGHALGPVGNVAHGHTSCILLPEVQRRNAPAIPHRHTLISAALDAPGAPVGDLLAALVQDLGQPSSLAEVDVPNAPELLRHMAELAFADPWLATNPLRFTTLDEVVQLLRSVAEKRA